MSVVELLSQPTEGLAILAYTRRRPACTKLDNLFVSLALYLPVYQTPRERGDLPRIGQPTPSGAVQNRADPGSKARLPAFWQLRHYPPEVGRGRARRTDPPAATCRAMCYVDNHAVPLARAAKYSLLLCDDVNKDLVLANAVGLSGVESFRLGGSAGVSCSLRAHMSKCWTQAASSADGRFISCKLIHTLARSTSS